MRGLLPKPLRPRNEVADHVMLMTGKRVPAGAGSTNPRPRSAAPGSVAGAPDDDLGPDFVDGGVLRRRPLALPSGLEWSLTHQAHDSPVEKGALSLMIGAAAAPCAPADGALGRRRTGVPRATLLGDDVPPRSKSGPYARR